MADKKIARRLLRGRWYRVRCATHGEVLVRTLTREEERCSTHGHRGSGRLAYDIEYRTWIIGVGGDDVTTITKEEVTLLELAYPHLIPGVGRAQT